MKSDMRPRSPGVADVVSCRRMQRGRREKSGTLGRFSGLRYRHKQQGHKAREESFRELNEAAC
jgi:hypothetical protein